VLVDFNAGIWWESVSPVGVLIGDVLLCFMDSGPLSLCL
jgi:hypothetical protein